jgi:hypothetical protein
LDLGQYINILTDVIGGFPQITPPDVGVIPDCFDVLLDLPEYSSPLHMLYNLGNITSRLDDFCNVWLNAAAN